MENKPTNNTRSPSETQANYSDTQKFGIAMAGATILGAGKITYNELNSYVMAYGDVRGRLDGEAYYSRPS